MHTVQTVLENNNLGDTKEQFYQLFGEGEAAFHSCFSDNPYLDKSFQALDGPGKVYPMDSDQNCASGVPCHGYRNGLEGKGGGLEETYGLSGKKHDEKRRHVVQNRGEDSSIPTSKSLYKKGYDSILLGDYIGAEKAFCAFYIHHKEDPLSFDALFWWAEALLRQERYHEAAQIYLTLWYTDKKIFYDSEILLKLAISIAALGKNKDDCTFFAAKEDRSQTLADAFCQHL
ncbi:hypothetical protein [Bartonella sp. CB178]|uniref:hypothetical protein n=1 Tax=Bartonella sp. CB178 TaxID=3112255 RepID=UPI00300E329C